MEQNKLNYEKDIHIDEDQLDVEWLEQPSLVFKYCNNESECEQRLDVEKMKLDLLKSELDATIRKTPSDYGIDKITETVVANTILATEEYQEAYIQYLDAKLEYNTARNAVKAFENRKKALENLVTLYVSGYFAGPKLPRNLPEEREMRQKKVDQGIANKMKRRRT